MHFSIALEDNLYEAFHNFKHGNLHDTHMVEKLLHLYKPPHITNVEQLKRLGIDNPPLISQLAQAGLLSQTIEELATNTIYKIIISSQNNHFPYVNIYGDPIRNNYTITCKPGESRTKALDLIRVLLKNAKSVIVCDRYLRDNWKTAGRIFGLFPEKGLFVEFVYPLGQQIISRMKKDFDKWKIKQDCGKVYRFHHDRYLLIDRKMEIVITSGMDYLFDDTKECTLVIRPRE